MSSNNSRVGYFLAFILILTSSCSTSKATPSYVPIKIGWTFSNSDYTLLIAAKKGFFSEHGLSVEPIKYESPMEAIPDIAGAKLDGGFLTMSDVFLASNMVDLRGVFVCDDGGTYSVVAAPEINSISDLRGKRIGLNLHSSSEMIVSYMLASQRMTSTDVEYVEVAPPQVALSIPGRIDAGLLWEPYTTQALKKGDKVIYENSYYSSLTPRVLVFRKRFIEQHPEEIRSFILAWNEALTYRASHQQESLDIISKETKLPISDLTISGKNKLNTILDNLELFSNNPGKDPTSIYYIAQFNRDFLITLGYITNPPELTTLLDPSFLK